MTTKKVTRPTIPASIEFIDIPAKDEHWYVETPDGLIISYYDADSTLRDSWPLFCSTTAITGMIPKTVDYWKWLGNYTSYDDAMKYMKSRAAIGTTCHDAMEHMNKHPKTKLDKTTYTDEEWDLIWGFCRAHKALQIKPLAVEERLADRDDMTAGTADLYGKVGHEYWMCDYKTSKGVYSSHMVQVQKYGRMKQKAGYPVDKLCVIRSAPTRRDGYELKIFDFDEQYDKDFECALHFFRRLYPKAGPQMKSVPVSLSLDML